MTVDAAPGEPPADAQRPAETAGPLAGDTPDDLETAVRRVEQELGALFARIRSGWREASSTVHPELQPFGYQVLTSIESGRATTAGAIMERLQTDKSTVSRQVRRLEELGLVESVPDPADRRARILAATPLARERITRARAKYQSNMGDRLRDWSEEDLARFSELLGRLGR
ncbi:MarR family winged helix-turn-helix transcriptional regulator [Agromyces archimandritae]|uniref:MarR family transcriptional regulator n=1 Tax=Agromyces archimandritae TaxID=2781962 RepID=A0A975FKG1_9MICO|nr:MarR family transcriptional regulator [Agromyces archimandritae]QTX03729.1 MarR family transcriptional regulator [Agromyces archimandritae]